MATETLLRRIFRVFKMCGPIPVHPKDDRERFRLVIIIDEAKILALGGDREKTILNGLFTEARKFGLGMIRGSQMTDHFSEDVKGNAATWLVLRPETMVEAKKNAPNISVTPDALMALKGKGDGYYRDGATKGTRRIQVTPIKAKAAG